MDKCGRCKEVFPWKRLEEEVEVEEQGVKVKVKCIIHRCPKCDDFWSESQEAIDQIRNEIKLRLTQIAPQSQPELKIMEPDQQERKEIPREKKYKSKLKPQLFNTISSIHQPKESAKTKKLKRFMKILKKPGKRTQKPL